MAVLMDYTFQLRDMSDDNEPVITEMDVEIDVEATILSGEPIIDVVGVYANRSVRKGRGWEDAGKVNLLTSRDTLLRELGTAAAIQAENDEYVRDTVLGAEGIEWHPERIGGDGRWEYA